MQRIFRYLAGASRGASLKLLLRYSKGHWKTILAGLAFAVVNQGFLMVDPLIFRRIIDEYGVQLQQHTREQFFMGVAPWLVAMLFAAFAAWVAKGWQIEMVSRFSQKASSRMFADGVRHSLELAYAEFEQRRSGEILELLQKVRGEVERFLSMAVNNTFTSMVGVALVTVYAATVHKGIAVFVLLIAPSLAGMSVLLTRKVKQVHESMWREGSELAGSATETLRNIELVKSLGLTRQEVANYRRASDRILNLELQKIRMARRFSFLHGAGVHLLRIALILALFYLLSTRQITVGQFFALYLYSFFVFGPMQDFGNVVRQYREMEVSLAKFRTFMAGAGESRVSSAPAIRRLSTLQFRGVTFRYRTAHVSAIADVSFEVDRGETIAFVGPSGAGKSTLVKLIVGLYTPSSGEILYNGTESSAVDLEQLRERVGLVTQDIQLFSGTIRQNLKFVCPEASDEDCLAALRQAAAGAMLARAPNGLDSLIGESGLRLSGGERQRLAIARALLRRPDLLVFDEATSSLDSLTEEEIGVAIRLATADSSVMTILIAHRLSTVLDADRIYVLDRGRIVQTGTHAELVDAAGLYRSIWMQQVGGDPDRDAAEVARRAVR